MFIFRYNRIIFNPCACTLFREFSSKVNPGARRRLRILEDPKDEDSDALDYEADFEHIHKTHRQHEQEMEIMREKHQYDIVKGKYFKSKYPNFLTWHDKQQIKLLHARDPEEWNVMKLSEGFPALPEIIHKIIKSNWRKENHTKIGNHDAAVRENWRRFKNNEYENLPEALKNHLRKFTDRKMNFYKYENEETDKTTFNIINTSGEFSEIISSYEKLKNENKNCQTKNSSVDLKGSQYNHKHTLDDDTYISGEIKNKQHFTLGALKNSLQRNIEKGKYLSNNDLSIVEVDMTKDNSPEKPVVDDLDLVKYNTGKIMVVDDKKPADYSPLNYPQRISIPKAICKRGYTYKLNDCYYDSDGRFLYRVPGMY